MTPRYVGNLNFARMNPSRPDLWQLEEPFGLVTSDGFLIVAKPWKYINGASIPRLVQSVLGVKLLGHPFEGDNKYWSPFHDQGYHGDALVLRLSDFADIEPEILLCPMATAGFVYEMFEDMHVDKPRSWFDRKAVEAMGINKKKNPLWKRTAVWLGVRAGGWKAWNEEHKQQ